MILNGSYLTSKGGSTFDLYVRVKAIYCIGV